MPNISSILGGNFDNVEAPKPIPVGTYIMAVDKVPTHKVFEQGVTEQIIVPLRTVQAGDDVSLEDYKGNPIGKIVPHTFWFHLDDEEALNRDMYFFKRFLEQHLGLDTAGRSTAQVLSQSVGARCYASVGVRPDPKNPEMVYPQIQKTWSLEQDDAS